MAKKKVEIKESLLLPELGAGTTYTIGQIPTTTITITDNYLFENQAGVAGSSEKNTALVLANYIKTKFSAGSGISYDNSTGVISATVPDLIQTQDDVTNTTCFLGFFNSSGTQSGQESKTSPNCTFNPRNSALTLNVGQSNFGSSITLVGGAEGSDAIFYSLNRINNGYYAVNSYATNSVDIWRAGLMSGNDNYRILDAQNNVDVFSITPGVTPVTTVGGTVNLSSLTASSAVVTDGSKNLSSLSYASANTVLALVQRDGSGNFSAGTITAALIGNSSTATALQSSRNINGTAFDGTSSITVGASTQTIATSGARFVGFYNSNANGNQITLVNAGLTFDPSTGNLTATTFTGALSGNATSATTALNVNNNLIVAGNFTLNPWQRGTSAFFPDVYGATISADRFSLQSFGGTGVYTVDKSSNAPTFAQCGVITSNAFRATVTTAQASLGSGDGFCINYNFHPQEWAKIAYQTFTLSFWVKSSLSGTYSVFFLDTNSGSPSYDTYLADYTINSANTWEKKIITVSTSPSEYAYTAATWWGFCLGAGSSSQGTANTWGVNSNARCTSNQVNFMATLNNTFELDLIKIEPGSTATPYINYSQEEVIAYCQADFEKSYSQGVNPAAVSTAGMIAINTGTATTNNLSQSVAYKVEKMSSPTITLYDAAGNSGKVTKGGDNKTGATANGGTRGFTGSSSDATSSSSMTFHWTAATGY